MPARTSRVVKKASTPRRIVRPVPDSPAQGRRGEHSHRFGSLNAVKATFRNFKFLKVAFTNHETQATEMASWCTPGPSAVTEASPLPERCSARTVHSPGAA